tara:strand:- start:15 stop:1022 length:1008 start_codon:yes stop_codon:yes gene_type:complete
MTLINKLDMIHLGNCLDLFKDIPDNSIDMIFADPPFNLKKKYRSIKDNMLEEEYKEWTVAWLSECVRTIKPEGSLFVHNIPKWLVHCVSTLNDLAHFKHWIAWDAPTAPMGKSLQPAHYGILFYGMEKKTKIYEMRYPHKRCRKTRSCNHLLKDYGGKKDTVHPFGPLVSDVWTDIHRIKHKKFRDNHPCQLPIHMLERIVLASTDEGDVVLDPFMGTGTTALAAKRLGRRYIGFEIDPTYQELCSRKLEAETFESKLGDAWVGFYRGEVLSLRNEDWEAVKEYFEIPACSWGTAIDFKAITLKKDIKNSLKDAMSTKSSKQRKNNEQNNTKNAV